MTCEAIFQAPKMAAFITKDDYYAVRVRQTQR
jgi:hypothetical protein